MQYPIGFKRLTGFLLTLPAVTVCQANLILLEDNFNDNSLDGAKWNVVTAGITQTPVSFNEQNGQAEFEGRAHLNTAQEFDPSSPATGGLRISGVWTYVSGDDFLQILTRSDGTPAGGFGETNAGIEFRLFDIGSEEVTISGRGATVNGVTPTSMPNGVGAGDSFDFVITDDGFNLSFSMTRTSNPADTVLVTGTSAFAPGTNLITFHNRESGRRSNLDDVVVESLTIVPEPSSAALVLLGGLLLARRRG